MRMADGGAAAGFGCALGRADRADRGGKTVCVCLTVCVYECVLCGLLADGYAMGR
jgi:hypothetical protein